MHVTKVEFLALLKEVWEKSLNSHRAPAKWVQML